MEFIKFLLRKSRKFVPMFILRGIINQYFSRKYIKSYSQYGEDLIIQDFFKRYLSVGMYLDIGAFHPIMISNTNLLHKNGWKGLAIDIDDFKLKLFERYRRNRALTQKRVVVAGFTESNQYNYVYKFKKPFSEIDTLDKQIAKKIKLDSGLEYKEDKVEAIGINNLLMETKYNFVNIDVEGVDEQLILSIDFRKVHAPDLIVFESWQPLTESVSIQFLEDNGYKHLFTTGGSIGYYLKSSIQNH